MEDNNKPKCEANEKELTPAEKWANFSEVGWEPTLKLTSDSLENLFWRNAKVKTELVTHFNGLVYRTTDHKPDIKI